MDEGWARLDATAQAACIATGAVSAAEALEFSMARADATAATLNTTPLRFED